MRQWDKGRWSAENTREEGDKSRPVIFLVYISPDWKYLFFLPAKEISIWVEIIYNAISHVIIAKSIEHIDIYFVRLSVFYIKLLPFMRVRTIYICSCKITFFLHIERQSIGILIANTFRCACTGMKRICRMNLPICKCEHRASYRVMILFLSKLIMHTNLIQFNFVSPSFFWEKSPCNFNEPLYLNSKWKSRWNENLPVT